MKKDILHSIVSKYGVITLAKNTPWLTLNDVPKYHKDGFAVRVKCAKCGNVHDIKNEKCVVCDKPTTL